MSDQPITFGPFRLHPRTGLTTGGRAVHLTPKALELLRFLALRPGEVVSKNELFEAIWPQATVGDAALVTCIQELRRALADDARKPRYIETMHRRGYRFVAPPAQASLPLPERPSLAVLPFANMSRAPDQDHIADGISEDLITALARIHWLFVIARNSSFVYKGRAVDVKEVARALGVRYLLEGSVRSAGNRLRVTTQLVDAISGSHQWAERYDRRLGEIFAIQDEITRSVAAAIEPRLLAAEGIRARAHATQDIGAWEMVARAATTFWRVTASDSERAITDLARAVHSYPDYAPAHSQLGFCLVFAAHMGWRGFEGLAEGRRHAMQAIALDELDPWGHIALGYAAMMQRQTEESIAAFRRAVALNPNSAAAHAYLGHGLAFAGADREAISHAREAIRLSPLDPEMFRFLGGIAVAHYTAGRYGEALTHTTEALRLRPGFQGAQRLRCASLAMLGRSEEARAALDLVRQHHPDISLDWIRTSVPYQTPELMEKFIEGMRRAGLR